MPGESEPPLPVSKGLLRFAGLEAIVILGALILAFGAYRVFQPKETNLAAEITAEMEAGNRRSADEAKSRPTETSDSHGTVIEERTPVVVLEPGDYPPIDLKRLRATHVKVTPYTVKLGENYWSVAKKFNVDVQTILGANPDMPFVSKVKQELLVPDRTGTLHAVAKGEKLQAIAELYQTKVPDLKKENSIPWWRGLKTGDVLFIPGAKPSRMDEKWRAYYSRRGIFGVPFASWGKGWTSKFGTRSDPLTGEMRKHGGMDFKARHGVDVFASASGRVIFAGVSGGYGNLIQIRHANGYLTYYGHLQVILVKRGQKVRRGQRIGKVGSTGRVTGPHLHFEIRKNGRPIDPLPLIQKCCGYQSSVVG